MLTQPPNYSSIAAMKFLSTCLAAVLLASDTALAAQRRLNTCKLLENPSGTIVSPDQVILVFNSTVDINAKAKQYGGTKHSVIVNKFQSIVKGLSIANFTDSECTIVENDPDVLYAQEVRFSSE